MTGVLEKRRELLRLMREYTLEKGFFTAGEIAEITSIPRSTMQDWINRLIEEKCVVLKEEQRGRTPARYITSTALLQAACKRIFTTVDGSRVAIFHHCMSSGCAGFCRFHHSLAGGVIDSVRRDGTILIEYADLGNNELKKDIEIGLYPNPAVGIIGIRKEDGYIVQTIKSTGGPAYSLTDMMGMARGVEKIDIKFVGNIVAGEVYTKAMTHVIIGIDDTDSKDGGATFAFTLGLLQYLSKFRGVIPVSHRVVMLNPKIKYCTAGNSASYIEIAVEPEELEHIKEIASRFVEDESNSAEYGFALKTGFMIPDSLRRYGNTVRFKEIDMELAERTAKENGIFMTGRRGKIGALAAIAFRDLDNDILINPSAEII
ncbi:conserved hypothetical protein [Methanolacinia petrolearia DSM 11571]|uniref:TiaS-like TCKD domain-containing protein n=1 Tax=Methanolacinia petrolearia (strain DSM 11571 / OCM 486 / SEBR 4847) TaxID=679926 RepID=E1RDP8_METP4|nr:hypothetical protein [Methanolacinia petrolearia]ADN36001.1 conserved hypothetical protein [Methanolacinia petrolearia DSM 11571]